MVQLVHPLLRAVQFKPVAGTAKAVGQNEVAARVNEGAIMDPHLVRRFKIPDLRGLPVGQAHGEQVGAGGPIRQQPLPLIEKLLRA